MMGANDWICASRSHRFGVIALSLGRIWLAVPEEIFAPPPKLLSLSPAMG